MKLIKPIYALKLESRDKNETIINMYTEDEIKRRFLDEKKEFKLKGYVLLSSNLFTTTWKCAKDTIIWRGNIQYYFIHKSQLWKPPSEQKEVSKYHYTISLLRTNVKITEEEKENDIDDDDIDRDDYDDDDDDIEEEIEYDDDDEIEEEIEFDPNEE